jgi:hypothetical protein
MAIIELLSLGIAIWVIFVSVRASSVRKAHVFFTTLFVILASPVGAITTSFWLSMWCVRAAARGFLSLL